MSSTSRGSQIRSTRTTLVRCWAAWTTTIASEWRCRTFCTNFYSLPGGLLRGDLQRSEWNNSGCVQPSSKRLPWNRCHLSSIVHQHSKTEARIYLPIWSLFDSLIHLIYSQWGRNHWPGCPVRSFLWLLLCYCEFHSTATLPNESINPSVVLSLALSMSICFPAMYNIYQPTLLVFSVVLLLESLHLPPPSMDLSP